MKGDNVNPGMRLASVLMAALSMGVPGPASAQRVTCRDGHLASPSRRAHGVVAVCDVDRACNRICTFQVGQRSGVLSGGGQRIGCPLPECGPVPLKTVEVPLGGAPRVRQVVTIGTARVVLVCKAASGGCGLASTGAGAATGGEAREGAGQPPTGTQVVTPSAPVDVGALPEPRGDDLNDTFCCPPPVSAPRARR
jgi:hypothetical protein